MAPSLALDFPSGPDEVDVDGLVCYVHFPGSTLSDSFLKLYASNSGLVDGFRVPEDAEAVCVTLAKRIRHGYVRHGRCRFSGHVKTETLRLKDEQLGVGEPAYGQATLVLNDVLQKSESLATLHREWFRVPESSQRIFSATNNEWFYTIAPSCEEVKKIHAPWWSNKTDSGVPGWCFAFPAPGSARYSESDLKEMFVLAGSMLRKKGHSSTELFALDNPAIAEILALGLTLFGLSIFYENDHTARSMKTVERFSSTARLDGIGDCEDIAKESAMAFSDLLALHSQDSFLKKLRSVAQNYQFCSCLGSVRRSPEKKIEAHAFGMLVPNALFPDTMLTDAERETKRVQRTTPDSAMRTYMCDGVYDCHPSKTKVPRGEATNDGQEAPWEYEHIVSAFVFGKGQVYFGDKQNRYGVKAKDFYPNASIVHEGEAYTLTDALGHSTTLEQRREAAEAVLVSNIPRQVRMFDHPNAPPVQRFKDVTVNTPYRASRFLQTFGATMEERTLKDFQGFAQGRLAPCMTPESFDTLVEKTSGFSEFAGQIQPDGALIKETPGQYGTVMEPDPSPLDKNEATVSVHTHHPHIGVEPRAFNPPTPEDFVSFVSRRALGMLTKDLREHDANIVVTGHHVYEMKDNGTKESVVSRLFLETDKTEDDVWLKATEMVKKLCCENEDSILTVDKKTHRFTLRGELNIFSEKSAHDQYLNFLERKTGVRCVYEGHQNYQERCLA